MSYACKCQISLLLSVLFQNYGCKINRQVYKNKQKPLNIALLKPICKILENEVRKCVPHNLCSPPQYHLHTHLYALSCCYRQWLKIHHNSLHLVRIICKNICSNKDIMKLCITFETQVFII